MEQSDHKNNNNDERAIDDLDALFDAVGAWRPGDAPPRPEAKPAAASGKDARTESGRRKQESDAAAAAAGDVVISEADLLALTGRGESGDKFVAVDPGAPKSAEITLVPARVYSYVPLWGWVTILLGLIVFAAAVVVLPGVSIDRLAARLGDDSDAVVHQAMRALLAKADERTVRTLFDMASSEDHGIKARLRAVDTMGMIEDVPAVDTSLLRLEVAESTNHQVREAAIAARKHREAASRARGDP